MTRAEIPDAVRDLITNHIDSAQQVEILVLLGKDPERAWAPDAVARELRIASAACSAWLERFASARLARPTAAGYRHRAGRVDDLIRCYATRRLAVLDLIYGNPQHDPAEAFGLREVGAEE
jgi:hypothetical protein